MTNRVGQQLGHYRLIRILGTGGFADVYLAEHIYLNTPAAVKLLNTSLISGEVQNFHNEARTIAHLIHKHIVRVLDFGLEDSIPYLVMEYAPNGTMRHHHPRGTLVPLSLVVQYVKQVASALQYAHINRLIHRDVKPENILLGHNNELLLGDFGAALMASTSLIFSTQNIIGTVSYMAPEQLRGKPVPASDQYALGIVAYEWLCGQCPFQGSLAELHHLQLHQPPPSLRAKIPSLSPRVEQVVMKALAKQPEQRFPTIQDFAQALEQASEQVQIYPPQLFLAGNGNAHNHAASLRTEAFFAPSPLPLPIAATQPVPSYSMENNANISQPVQPRLSRRVFVGSLACIVALGGAGAALWWEQKGNGQAATSDPPPTPTSTPKPKATPAPTKSDALYVYRGQQDQVFTASWSPNDRYIASAGGNIHTRKGDNGVHVWEALTGQDVYPYLGHPLLVRMVAWSPNGSRIASASEDKTVQVWDAYTGNNILVYSGHTNEVWAVTWSPDGTRIASASKDHTVQVWDAITTNLLFSYTGHVQGVTSVAWSPDGNFIASASSDGIVNICDAFTGKTLQTFSEKAWVGSLAWAPDSISLVTGDYNDDDSVRIWNTKKESYTQVFPGTIDNQVYTVAWSPDGKYIAAGYQDGRVNVWQYATGKQILTYTGHNAAVMSVQWSHNGKYIVSCGFDKTVQVWTIARVSNNPTNINAENCQSSAVSILLAITTDFDPPIHKLVL